MTRMRCWRITASTSSHDQKSAATNGTTSAPSSDADKKMEISIEYLLSKDNLKWITLQTDQAILLSMCLQVGYGALRACSLSIGLKAVLLTSPMQFHA